MTSLALQEIVTRVETLRRQAKHYRSDADLSRQRMDQNNSQADEMDALADDYVRLHQAATLARRAIRPDETLATLRQALVIRGVSVSDPSDNTEALA